MNTPICEFVHARNISSSPPSFEFARVFGFVHFSEKEIKIKYICTGAYARVCTRRRTRCFPADPLFVGVTDSCAIGERTRKVCGGAGRVNRSGDTCVAIEKTI